MSNRVIKKPVAVAISAALISSIVVAGVAHASAYAVSALGAGYMLAAGDPPAGARLPAVTVGMPTELVVPS